MGIGREQALDCWASDDLIGLGMEADAVRLRLHPEGVVSYVVGRSVKLGSADEGAREAVCAQAEETSGLGGTAVRLEVADGLVEMPAEWCAEVVSAVRRRCPGVWLEGWNAPAVRRMATAAGEDLRESVARLRDAGLDAIGGDGALIGDVRGDGAGSCSLTQWLEVHRAAHGVGMRTVAALEFGAGETLAQRADALSAVRRMQEETGGFTACMPLSHMPHSGRELDGTTAVESMKTLAIVRIMLETIENVQVTGVGLGLKARQMALRFGANDMGTVALDGITAESEEDVRWVIRDAGFRPVHRDMPYRTMFLS